MRFLILALVVSACGGGPEREAERALARAAPRSYRAYIAARDAREAVLRDGGAARQGALRARERADAAVAAAQNARKIAGREADEKAAREGGYEEANAAYEKYLWSGSGPESTPEESRALAEARVARDRAMAAGAAARRAAENAAIEAGIEAQESQERIYRKTNSQAVRTLEAAERALWQAERRLCRAAPAPWRLYAEVMDLEGVVIPPC